MNEQKRHLAPMKPNSFRITYKIPMTYMKKTTQRVFCVEGNVGEKIGQRIFKEVFCRKIL